MKYAKYTLKYETYTLKYAKYPLKYAKYTLKYATNTLKYEQGHLGLVPILARWIAYVAPENIKAYSKSKFPMIPSLMYIDSIVYRKLFCQFQSNFKRL